MDIVESMVKVYLDACCLSRLTDGQVQARIQEEAAAVERVLAGVRLGTVELISSEALADEVRRNPSMERRVEAEALLSLATTIVEVNDAVARRAQELVGLGYSPFDALHIAAAEAVKVDVLLSTDDRLIKRAARGVGNPQIQVRNPVSWIKEQE